MTAKQVYLASKQTRKDWVTYLAARKVEASYCATHDLFDCWVQH